MTLSGSPSNEISLMLPKTIDCLVSVPRCGRFLVSSLMVSEEFRLTGLFIIRSGEHKDVRAQQNERECRCSGIIVRSFRPHISHWSPLKTCRQPKPLYSRAPCETKPG